MGHAAKWNPGFFLFVWWLYKIMKLCACNYRIWILKYFCNLFALIPTRVVYSCWRRRSLNASDVRSPCRLRESVKSNGCLLLLRRIDSNAGESEYCPMSLLISTESRVYKQSKLVFFCSKREIKVSFYLFWLQFLIIVTLQVTMANNTAIG